jgi:hypothetical protein
MHTYLIDNRFSFRSQEYPIYLVINRYNLSRYKYIGGTAFNLRAERGPQLRKERRQLLYNIQNLI